MTTTVQRPPRNGVDVPTLFATLDAGEGRRRNSPSSNSGRRNEWISGTHSRSAHPGLLRRRPGGHLPRGPVHLRRGPSLSVSGRIEPTARRPVEFLLHAIAACITTGLANIAAARGITLHRVSSTVEGDIDLLGVLGLSGAVRNGYRQIRVHFDVAGDASPEQLLALVEQSRSRSAAYDVLVNGTDVQIDVSTR